jgi:hypothetical protein
LCLEKRREDDIHSQCIYEKSLLFCFDKDSEKVNWSDGPLPIPIIVLPELAEGKSFGHLPSKTPEICRPLLEDSRLCLSIDDSVPHFPQDIG